MVKLNLPYAKYQESLDNEEKIQSLKYKNDKTADPDDKDNNLKSFEHDKIGIFESQAYKSCEKIYQSESDIKKYQSKFELQAHKSHEKEITE